MFKRLCYMMVFLLTCCSSQIDYSGVKQPIYIKESNNYDINFLSYSLNQSLRSRGIEVTDDIKKAQLVLALHDIKKESVEEHKKKLANYNNIFYKNKYSVNLVAEYYKDNKQKIRRQNIVSSSPTIIRNNQNNFSDVNDSQLFHELELDIIHIIINKLLFLN